jgi:hypothetical protein
MPFVVVAMSEDHFSQLQSNLQDHKVCKNVGMSSHCILSAPRPLASGHKLILTEADGEMHTM